MDVKTSKVPAKLESLCNRQIGKILVSEGDHLTFSNKSSKLVLSCVAQLAELHACYFCANGGGEVVCYNPWSKELWIASIGI